MRVIDVYDIANDNWYKQPTRDGPGALTRGCAVVATASDQSSFNIYYYGGFDGVNVRDEFSDEVWVLSMPSFTWTRLNEGDSIHARAGHRCVTPYSDQMMVVGGFTPQAAGGNLDCLDNGPIVMFNLSSGEWMDEYDPEKHDDYGVPTRVQDKIGGDAAGGATMTTPSPSWAATALGALFRRDYDMEKISTWGPFEAETTTSRPTLPPDDDDDDGGGGGGLPSWVAPVLGVVLGLIAITTAIILFCLWKRRGLFKNRSSEGGTEDPGNRIVSWMRGHPSATEKAGTITSSEEAPPTSPEMAHVYGSSMAATSPGLEPPPNRHEMGDTQLNELEGTFPFPPKIRTRRT